MNIDIRFKQEFSVDKETTKIIDSFGLSNIKEHVIVTNFELNIELKKIYYISGYSGSGKSQILRKINENLEKLYDVIYIVKWDRLKIPNKSLIEFFRNISSDERLSILSKCGLGEAWKFVSLYNDLSDGEKFRFILYKSIMDLRDKPNPVLIFDEFAATLDRITAKAIANNISRLRDKFGITFILASAHDDLIDYLNADVVIFKEFDESVTVENNKDK